jgi:UDP-N-acetylmuramoyl-tripeptide--D-alanyl-D-alanine ligase
MIDPLSLAALALFWAGLAYFGMVRTRTLLAYFQQEEYDPARFFAAWRDIRLYDVVASGLMIAAFVFSLEGVGGSVLYLLLGFALAAIGRRERAYRFKKPLVMTARATGIYRLALGLAGVLSLAALAYPVLEVLVIQALPLVLVLANAILKPGEDRRNAAYVAEAAQKLAEFKGVRIGVTGSFGKTSVKHILAQLLNLDAPVFYSRGSINTVLGLTRHIRQRLQPAHRYFIAEMGAYQRGSIARLAEFIKPEIGIITAVGEAHLERFGSLEDTARAKAELADYVCAHGRLVVVTETVAALAPFASLREKYPQKFVVCGEGETSDVRLLSTGLSAEGRTFEVDIDGTRFTFVSPLLASYNALNICLCLAVVRAVAPGLLPSLSAAVADLEQVPHRLERKEGVSGPLVLDDAYNANEAGIREAVDVAQVLARQQGGRAVMITPGIVELGASHDAVHRSLGEWAGARCDLIHVVNPDRIPSFVSAAQSADHATVTTHPSLTDARKALVKDSLGRTDVILYANDLPDVLEEKRFL